MVEVTIFDFRSSIYCVPGIIRSFKRQITFSIYLFVFNIIWLIYEYILQMYQWTNVSSSLIVWRNSYTTDST